MFCFKADYYHHLEINRFFLSTVFNYFLFYPSCWLVSHALRTEIRPTLLVTLYVHLKKSNCQLYIFSKWPLINLSKFVLNLCCSFHRFPIASSLMSRTHTRPKGCFFFTLHKWYLDPKNIQPNLTTPTFKSRTLNSGTIVLSRPCLLALASRPQTNTAQEHYPPVLGPHCAQSFYGCCPDGHTSATGPRNEGCAHTDCVRSRWNFHDTIFVINNISKVDYFFSPLQFKFWKNIIYRYGCCLDGVTAATGFGRAGCPEYQTVTTVVKI